MATAPIDLARLPAPNVIERLDFEALMTATRADLEGRYQDYSVSEADPASKVLESGAYLVLLLRQRVNDGAKAVLLAHAEDADLDNLAALFNVERLIVAPADPAAIPPVEAVYESDERLRARVQLALSAVSTAGPVSSYRFHALGASADVLDVAVASPAPGSITVTVLSRNGDGTAPQTLLDTVSAALNADNVRPLGDVLTVQEAAIVSYQITASLTIGSGVDSAVVLAAAIQAVTAFAASARRIGYDIPRSALFAALHQPGVEAVSLTSPAADVAVGAAAASHASAITITKD